MPNPTSTRGPGQLCKTSVTSYQSTKAYHRPGWEAYAKKVEAERELERQNAKVVLKEKRIKAGSSLYIFSVKRGKNGKPYLVITGNAEKIHYRGSIIVFAPYVPVFLSKLREMANGLE
jgi:hypothetical protein